MENGRKQSKLFAYDQQNKQTVRLIVIKASTVYVNALKAICLIQ